MYLKFEIFLLTFITQMGGGESTTDIYDTIFTDTELAD